MIKKSSHNTQFYHVSIFAVFLIILFIALGLYVAKELSISSLKLLLPFIPNFIFMLVGILLFVFFLIIFIMGVYEIQKSFGTTKRLVTTGIFSYVRNPIYVGVSFILIGIALFLRSTGVLVAGIALLLFSYNQARKEERHLDKTYGKSYEVYKKNTPRFIPNFVLIVKDILNAK